MSRYYTPQSVAIATALRCTIDTPGDEECAHVDCLHCPDCSGTGDNASLPCDTCDGTGFWTPTPSPDAPRFDDIPFEAVS